MIGLSEEDIYETIKGNVTSFSIDKPIGARELVGMLEETIGGIAKAIEKNNRAIEV